MIKHARGNKAQWERMLLDPILKYREAEIYNRIAHYQSIIDGWLDIKAGILDRPKLE